MSAFETVLHPVVAEAGSKGGLNPPISAPVQIKVDCF